MTMRINSSVASLAASQSVQSDTAPAGRLSVIDSLDTRWLPPEVPEKGQGAAYGVVHGIGVALYCVLRGLCWPLERLADAFVWLAGRESVQAALKREARYAAAAENAAEEKLRTYENTHNVAQLDARAAQLSAAVATNQRQLDALAEPLKQARTLVSNVDQLTASRHTLESQIATLRTEEANARRDATRAAAERDEANRSYEAAVGQNPVDPTRQDSFNAEQATANANALSARLWRREGQIYRATSSIEAAASSVRCEASAYSTLHYLDTALSALRY